MAGNAGTASRDVRARLADLAAGRGVSLAALSRLIGRNGSYLQQFITRGSPRRLAEGDRRVLAQFFGVSEAELGGEAARDSRRRTGEFVDIPRLPLDASAGPGALAADEAPFDALRFSRRWLRRQGLDPGMLALIAVTGDSMEPVLRDGDEILVDRTPRPLREGIHVVRIGEVLHIKRIQAGRPGKLMLISDNPAYPPVEVELGDADVIGQAVWKGGRL